MIPPKTPKNEKERLAALDSYDILDTISEQAFDDITGIAAFICNTPISLVSLIDNTRQWFKSHHGLDATETPREIAYCAHAINVPDKILEVEDAFEDERFNDNPLATGDPHVRFYAGAPLVDSNGHALGTLCVIDHKPRKLTEEQRAALSALSRQVISQLELRKNINELRQTKRQQKADKNAFADRIERVGDMVFELNEAGYFIYVNPALIRTSGYTERELLSMHFSQLVHENHREKAISYYVDLAKSKKKSSNFQFLMETPKGPIWVDQNVEMEFEKGRATRIFGIARDIQKLVEAREAITESEKKYRLISENSQDLICLHEPDGTYKFLSSSVKELLGYEPDELIGTNPYDLFHPDEIDSINEISHKPVLNGETLSNFEYRIRKKNGDYIWLATNSKPILNDKGVVVTIQTSSRDATSRKKYETELQLARELAEKAKEEAILSKKAKEDFLSTMSHEIRTPMNAILGVTNLLLDDNLKPEQREHLDLLKFSGENLLSLINSILDLGKIESGKIEFERINFNLKETCHSIQQSLRPKAMEKGLELKLLYHNDLPEVFVGDSLRVAQIINNLVGNAIKFTEQGFVKIEVTQKAHHENRSIVHFEIHDTGLGISKKHQKRIFDNFSQASLDISRKFGGTGLGLSITKKILELLGSNIHLVSEVGYGSIFYFDLSLPLGKTVQKKLEKNISKNTAKKTERRDARILVAEDNKANQIVLHKFMSKWGINVDIAENGIESIEMAKTESYNLILMDLQMPEMDGYEAVNRIRAFESNYTQNVPIIALTASAMPEVKKKVKASGFDDYMSKPFNPEELHDKIMKYLDRVKVKVCDKNNLSSIKKKIIEYADGDEEFLEELSGFYIGCYEKFRTDFIEAINTENKTLLNNSFEKIESMNEAFKLELVSNIFEKARNIIESKSGSKPQIIKEVDNVCGLINRTINELKHETAYE